MAESRKSPRPKGPRNTGPAGKPTGRPKGRTGGKSGGSYGGSSGGRDDDWRSGAPAKSGGPGGAGKPRRKGPGGPSKSYSGGPRKEGDPRVSGGYGKPKGPGRPPRRDDARRDDSAPAKSARVDDFDFDMDLGDAAPAGFPQPARTGKNAPPPRPQRERAPRREDDFRRPDRPERAPRAVREDAAEPEDGKSVTAGRNPVRELLEAAPKRIDGVFVRKGQRDAKVQEIVALADENRIKVQFVDDAVLRRLYSGTHQGVVAVTAAVEYADLDTLIASVAAAPLPVLLALDQVQDPGNLGAMTFAAPSFVLSRTK